MSPTLKYRGHIISIGVIFAVLVSLLLAIYNAETILSPTYERRVIVKRQQNFSLDTAATNFSSAFPISGNLDDDHTCAAGRPCLNRACCGANGVCGYGPDYCGNGCQSNCDARAECGKFAAEPGKDCPLNACCSEFGFCGTTEPFCNSKCQSNCVLHPQPPAHEPGDVLQRIIGYYEGWNARSKCHETKPTDLPLAALTHINFAFAFVEPVTYDIIPMTDGKTSAGLFAETAALKSYNPDLKVFVSLGGWTFSDNGTTTQPLLGEIARSPLKRKFFANKIVRFLHGNGFDGLDLDWEYPGAPDRGGSPDDTANMVLLFADIREAFTNSGEKYELTFTIPASYWYLRWFDVPSLLKYADWTNLMSYDIHGLWDRDNEIGNIVQPHTNLTEIQLAAELLCRVGVHPSKVTLGLGFYGRSFTLSDPACDKPKCKFRDAAKPGVCTNTAGFLAYYEIQDILSKNTDIVVKHEKEAAIKYFSWDKDQWISFDDKTTFAQKVQWANSVGMSGVLLWASDLDDYTFSAHSGLLGVKVKPNNQYEPTNPSGAGGKLRVRGLLTDIATPEYHKDCYIIDACVDPAIIRCQPGYTKVGDDESDCGGSPYVKPICCKRSVAPKTCTWRGGGEHFCNGQCHPGEVTLFRSRVGGGPDSESGTSWCRRGDKVFCCSDDRFTELTSGCAWTSCGVNSCQKDEVEIASAGSLDDKCSAWTGKGQKYCCKGTKKPLENCHWVGQGDCADNTCDNKETTLATDTIGPWWVGKSCNWWRKAALCCTPNLKSLTTAACEVPTCSLGSGSSSACAYDPYADDDSASEECDPETEDCSQGLDSDSDGQSLLTPNRKRRFIAARIRSHRVTIILQILARLYPGSTRLHDSTRGASASPFSYRPKSGSCDSTEIEEVLAFSLSRAARQAFYDTEHNPDLQYVRDLLGVATNGVLMDGTLLRTRPIDGNFFNTSWNAALSPDTFPRAGPGARDLRTPEAYFMDQFGSRTNRAPLQLCERSINQMKGRVFNRENDPQTRRTFNDNLELAISGGSEDLILQPIREVIMVFRYMHTPSALRRIQRNRIALREATRRISLAVPDLSRLHDIHLEFDNNWYQTLTRQAYEWVQDRINQVIARYDAVERQGTPAANSRRVRTVLARYSADLQTYIKPPPDI